jgi:hypothetical protein
VVVQVILIVADPGDAAAGAEQDARNIQYGGGVREVIEPTRSDQAPAGASVR